MSGYRCDCGDTECPSCGSAQGTYPDPDVGCWGECDACGDFDNLAPDGLCQYCIDDMDREAARQEELNKFLEEEENLSREENETDRAYNEWKNGL